MVDRAAILSVCVLDSAEFRVVAVEEIDEIAAEIEWQFWLKSSIFHGG